MRVLACVPHYFDRTKTNHSLHGSSQDNIEQRIAYVQFCITQLRSVLASHTFLMGTSAREPGIVNTDVSSQEPGITGDVFVCSYQDKHILDDLKIPGVRHVKSGQRTPMMLGYLCRSTFAHLKDDYDLFCYIEDDTAILDPDFFSKVVAFYTQFGERKVVLPQRYELFGNLGIKTYQDHPTPFNYRIAPTVDGEPHVAMPSFAGPVRFEQTLNHGTGCYVITRRQLQAWMTFDEFLRPVGGSGMDPLEQAMIPMSGRYPMYKTATQNINFLEVHHVPDKLCHAQAPLARIRTILNAAPRAPSVSDRIMVDPPRP